MGRYPESAGRADGGIIVCHELVSQCREYSVLRSCFCLA